MDKNNLTLKQKIKLRNFHSLKVVLTNFAVTLRRMSWCSKTILETSKANAASNNFLQ